MICFLTGAFFTEAALLAAVYVVFLAFAFHGPSHWEGNQAEFGFFIDHFTFLAGLLFAAVHGPGQVLAVRRSLIAQRSLQTAEFNAGGKTASYSAGLKPTVSAPPTSSTGRLIIVGWAAISAIALLFREPLLVLVGQSAERRRGAVEQLLPADLARPFLEPIALDPFDAVVRECIGDAAILEPGRAPWPSCRSS